MITLRINNGSIKGFFEPGDKVEVNTSSFMEKYSKGTIGFVVEQDFNQKDPISIKHEVKVEGYRTNILVPTNHLTGLDLSRKEFSQKVFDKFSFCYSILGEIIWKRKENEHYSNLGDVIKQLNSLEIGDFEIKHKFGDTYIFKNTYPCLNVTYMANQSIEYIVAEVKKKV